MWMCCVYCVMDGRDRGVQGVRGRDGEREAKKKVGAEKPIQSKKTYAARVVLLLDVNRALHAILVLSQSQAVAPSHALQHPPAERLAATGLGGGGLLCCCCARRGARGRGRSKVLRGQLHGVCQGGGCPSSNRMWRRVCDVRERGGERAAVLFRRWRRGEGRREAARGRRRLAPLPSPSLPFPLFCFRHRGASSTPSHIGPPIRRSRSLTPTLFTP